MCALLELIQLGLFYTDQIPMKRKEATRLKESGVISFLANLTSTVSISGSKSQIKKDSTWLVACFAMKDYSVVAQPDQLCLEQWTWWKKCLLKKWKESEWSFIFQIQSGTIYQLISTMSGWFRKDGLLKKKSSPRLLVKASISCRPGDKKKPLVLYLSPVLLPLNTLYLVRAQLQRPLNW